MRNSLGYEIRCDNKIELGRHVVVYCVMQAGHEGCCQPDDSFLPRAKTKARCQATAPVTGQQCGLPQGHDCKHSNGNAVLPWS